MVYHPWIILPLVGSGHVPYISGVPGRNHSVPKISVHSLAALLLASPTITRPFIGAKRFPLVNRGALRKYNHRVHMSLLPANQPWAVSAGLVLCTAVGTLVGKTRMGEALSPPVCAMAVGAIFANLGVFPSITDCATIGTAQSLCVRFATPLLLLGADLRTVAAKSGRLLKVFFAGSICSMFGASLGYELFLSGNVDGIGVEEARKLAAALAAKNIGGGLNYVAMCQTLQISSATQAIGLTVDNFGAVVYFPLCNFLGRNVRSKNYAQANAVPETSLATLEQLDGEKPSEKVLVDLADLSMTLALTTSIVAISEAVWPAGSLISSTILTTALATAFPKQLGKLATCGDLIGALFLFVFFATAGIAGGSVGSSLVGAGPSIAGYLGCLYVVNLSLLLGLGHLFGIDRRLTLTASNANIGGPATASAFCIGQGWSSLTTPALLVGTFGNVIANFLALWLHWVWSGGKILAAISERVASR